LEWRACGRREGRALAKRCVAFTVARPPAITGHAKASHCDVVLRLGMWHLIGRRPTLVRLSGPAVRQGGTATRAK
jgi:hypothetical protein